MTNEQLRKMHQAKPFVPFTLHLADGRSVRVEHPEFLMQTPSGRTVHVAKTDDSFEIIDLLSVTSIEGGEGRAPRKRRRS
ncbi:MAG: hypothetical protein V3W34_08290 [Phycisphaerae bacterium]